MERSCGLKELTGREEFTGDRLEIVSFRNLNSDDLFLDHHHPREHRVDHDVTEMSAKSLITRYELNHGLCPSLSSDLLAGFTIRFTRLVFAGLSDDT